MIQNVFLVRFVKCGLRKVGYKNLKTSGQAIILTVLMVSLPNKAYSFQHIKCLHMVPLSAINGD